MNKTAEEAEREVEASRGELDRTVEALKDKMTPGQLLDEATRSMGDAGGQIFSKFVEQAKENPMPLAVMGLGLAWLMTSNNKARSVGAPTSYDMPTMADRSDGGARASGGVGAVLGKAGGGLSSAARGVSDSVSGATGAVRDAAEGMRDRVADGAQGVLEGAQHAAIRAKDMAGNAARKAGEYGQGAQQTVKGMVEREPLLIGGAGLLAGLAIGASLPATEAEKRYVAPIKDKVVDKTMAMAQDRLDQVSDAAQAAYHAVKDELQNGGQDGAGPAERAEQVVHTAAQSLRDPASTPH